MAMEPLKDKLTPQQFEGLNYAASCENCSHFDQSQTLCTFGFPVEPFLRARQLADMTQYGEIAFCRAIEID